VSAAAPSGEEKNEKGVVFTWQILNFREGGEKLRGDEGDL